MAIKLGCPYYCRVTLTSQARVATDRPGRYIKQLCDHLGRKIDTEYDDTRGRVTLAAGTCVLTAEDGALLMRASADDAESLARLEDVVGRHLERFGTRDELTVTWVR